MKGKGIVLREPAVVAIERESKKVLAVGSDAYRMIGRTPGSVLAVRPLRQGTVADFELTSTMLRYFVSSVIGRRMFARPRAVISVPSGVNEMEKRSIISIMFDAGMRRTQLLDRPIAAALGVGLQFQEAYGTMIVDMGAGVTDIAVLSMGEVVVASCVPIGGDYFGNEEGGYVVRMTETYRKKPLKSRDMLVTDMNGDFHIIKNSDSEQLKALVQGETPIVNVFNFGPALVIDGELQQMPDKYNYNIRGLEPRCAIGQVGPLEYVLVVVDGGKKRTVTITAEDGTKKKSTGCTVETLAQFMADQGCQQAYNLDGGNSALMVFHGENYSQKSFSAERSVSDIIYFATAIDFGLDGADKE